ncbi:MAG: hypothetical protein Q7S40_19965 [Opitutaceae bacterium]|nr:hypothetical protein [Opitutaceae bacterium]
MNTPRALVALIALALVGFAGPAGAAQQDGRNLTTIDFPGGTLAQLVKSISGASESHFNLVGETADLATELPAFSIRNADTEAVANALGLLLNGRGLSIIRAPQQRSGPNPSDIPVYVLMKRSGDTNAFESFQLGPYLEKQSVDDIVSAVRTAWELQPQNKPEALQLKFHPATSLLLVSGTPGAIAVASKVISTLSGPPEKTKTERVQAERDRLQAVSAEVVRRRQEREKGMDKAGGKPRPRDAAPPPPAAEKK